MGVRGEALIGFQSLELCACALCGGRRLKLKMRCVSDHRVGEDCCCVKSPRAADDGSSGDAGDRDGFCDGFLGGEAVVVVRAGMMSEAMMRWADHTACAPQSRLAPAKIASGYFPRYSPSVQRRR